MRVNMIKKESKFLILIASILIVVFSISCGQREIHENPFTLKKGLFNQKEIDSLGLFLAKDVETITVFKPTDSTDHFSNGAVMTVFKNQFYCQWQSSNTDEDSEDTWVAYSKSDDGQNWSEPMILSASLEHGISTSGGWWVYDDILIAFINEWPSNISPKGGFTYYKTSIDGIHWSNKKPVLMADGKPMQGVFEQDPHALPDGRIISAAHFQPGLKVSPIYTDDPKGISGWTRANFTNSSIKDNVSREIEPSWFLKDNENVVMVFRDQLSSHYILASISKDQGENWTNTVITDMPDSRSKQSAGNLPNGTSFLVNNPVNNKNRMPLAITLSKNGSLFTKAYALRKGNTIQPMRYQGKYKRLGYHYPKSFVWKNHLYISYTTNKEDVEFTKVPIHSLVLD